MDSPDSPDEPEEGTRFGVQIVHVLLAILVGALATCVVTTVIARDEAPPTMLDEP